MDSAPAQAATQPSPNQVNLPIQFHGTGSEYFRIWIVNLLLVIVTLTLYYPWARVRKLVYFAENTTIGGDPLSFHGQAKQMFIGYFVALVGAIAYAVSQELLPLLAALLLLVYLCLWPWLFRMAHRFRLGKTRWRGLAFGFCGTNRGAYLTFLVPLIVYGLVIFLGYFLNTMLLEFEDTELPDTEAGGTIAFVAGLMTLIGALALPYVVYLVKRYQHGNFAYASVRAAFDASAGSFYLIAIKTLALAILAYLAMALVAVLAVFAIALLMGLSFENLKDFDLGHVGIAATFFAAAIGFYLVIYLLSSAISAYFQAAVFNLSWNKTSASQTRFMPSLKFSALWRLKVKNTLLILLTLGLYIPFAQVAMARLKLHSLQIDTGLDMSQVIADVHAGRVSAAADAAADILDVDIGI